MMQKTKTLLLNAQQMQARFRIKHVHYADTQNALAPVLTSVAADGNHGVIYAALQQNTVIGSLPHQHAVGPRD